MRVLNIIESINEPMSRQTTLWLRDGKFYHFTDRGWAETGSGGSGPSGPESDPIFTKWKDDNIINDKLNPSLLPDIEESDPISKPILDKIGTNFIDSETSFINLRDIAPDMNIGGKTISFNPNGKILNQSPSAGGAFIINNTKGENFVFEFSGSPRILYAPTGTTIYENGIWNSNTFTFPSDFIVGGLTITGGYSGGPITTVDDFDNYVLVGDSYKLSQATVNIASASTTTLGKAERDIHLIGAHTRPTYNGENIALESDLMHEAPQDNKIYGRQNGNWVEIHTIQLPERFTSTGENTFMLNKEPYFIESIYITDGADFRTSLEDGDYNLVNNQLTITNPVIQSGYKIKVIYSA